MGQRLSCGRRRQPGHQSGPAIRRWRHFYLVLVRGPALQAIWRRWVRRQLRLRRLQRIFGNVGQFLQLFPASLRARLQKQLPKC